MKSDEHIILGIDPGTNVMGYGIILIHGKVIKLQATGILKLNKYDEQMTRLAVIFNRVSGLIQEFNPDELAVEAPFYGKNVQSMLKLGRAQGVAISAALNAKVPVFEYSPRKIKQAITGKGSASKEQVAAMIAQLLNVKEIPDSLDATDALAAAVCHHFQKRILVKEKIYTGWKAFIADNPERKL